MKRISLFLLILCRAGFAAECTSQWVLGSSNTLSGDTSANYAYFNYPSSGNIQYEIEGVFPNARYMSFCTNSFPEGKLLDTLADREIIPDNNAKNPFTTGGTIGAPVTYTVRVSAEKISGQNQTGNPAGPTISLWYRVYSINEGGTFSQAQLPRIFAKYPDGSGAPCPVSTQSKQATLAHAATSDRQWRPEVFIKADNSEIPFPNPHSGYLNATFTALRYDAVLVRGRAPSFPNTFNGGIFDETGKNVRYWSVCLTPLHGLSTLGCVPDHRAPKNSDGDFKILFVNRGVLSDSTKQNLVAQGYGVLEVSSLIAGRAIFRNILPSPTYAGNFESIPVEAVASDYIGDYAPEISRCTFTRSGNMSCEP